MFTTLIQQFRVQKFILKNISEMETKRFISMLFISIIYNRKNGSRVNVQ